MTRSMQPKTLVALDIDGKSQKHTIKKTVTTAQVHEEPAGPSSPFRAEELFNLDSSDSSYHDTSNSNEWAMTPDMTAKSVCKHLEGRKKEK